MGGTLRKYSNVIDGDTKGFNGREGGFLALTIQIQYNTNTNIITNTIGYNGREGGFLACYASGGPCILSGKPSVLRD